MFILESVADRQAIWSETANSLKLATERARYTTFIGSFLGALLAALATFDLVLFDLKIGPYLAALSAISLGLVTFVTARWLSKDVVDRHIRARLASESLKREAFLYATHSGIYSDSETRDANLLKQKTEIEKNVYDLLLFEEKPDVSGNHPRSSSCPREDLGIATYIEQRVDKQIKYFVEKSEQYNSFSNNLHNLELALSLVAALIAVLAATFEHSIKWAAITAALTTLAGIVVTHLEASRYDKLIPVYRITANQLENIKLKMQFEKHPDTDYIIEFENVLTAQNSAWFELWAKPTPEEKNT